jgi:lipid II:glycine glycyltransferase (peptidoglycan interpeptide bridge formation enzyme)
LHQREFSEKRWFGTLTYSHWETFLITLRGSSEDYFANQVKRTQRQHVRASQKAGLEVISGPSTALVNDYYRLYSRVHDERGWTGTKFSASFFRDVHTTLGRGGELVVMQYNGRVVGGGVLLYDRYAVHIFQATTDRDVKGVYPHPVLYKTAIERAESQQLSYVNLGGIGPGGEGLERFKLSWGAQPIPTPRITWRSHRRTMMTNVSARLRALIDGVAAGQQKQ